MSKAKNTNCLAGMQCRACGSLAPFDIVAKALFHHVTDEGTDECSGVEWDLNSPCTCCQCHHHGSVQDFIGNGKLPVLKPFSVLLRYPDSFQPTDGLDTFYEHTMAVDGADAVKKVQDAACAVNRIIGVVPGDFEPVIVLAGHCECEPYDNQKG